MARIDLVAYPPTSFPYRDLLVLEQLGIEPEHRLCEIGVGSGATTARLARLCAEVTGFEISAPTVDALRYLEERHPNLRLVVADVTEDATLAAHRGRFDRVLSCDTLKHVDDPAAYFRSVAALLAPGGQAVITFPNEPRERMHGITRFDGPEQLGDLVRAAGLVDVRLGAARLTPHAERVADALGWRPLAVARGVGALARLVAARAGLGGGGGARDEAAAAPQTFDETRFFRSMKRWRRLSPAVNLYWYGVLNLMAARGPTFEIDWDFRETPFDDCQVFISAHRAHAAHGSGQAAAS